MADYDSQEAAREAMASYEHHYPHHGPYFVESRDSVPKSAREPKSSGAFPWVLGAIVIVTAVLGVAFLLFQLGRVEVALEGGPRFVPAERATPGDEPTAPPVAAQPELDQPEGAEPPARRPTVEPEEVDEVRLTQGAGTTAQVFARGVLNCGVSGRAYPFSETQADGSVVGFDVDMCRAVAAAMLGDADAVNLVELSAAERFTALSVGDVDVLMRNSTWTQSRDTDVGVDFGPTTYFDGQQLMGRASDGFTASSQIADIDGAIVCTTAGTTTELAMVAEADNEGVSIELLTFQDFGEVTEAFIERTCDLITIDGSFLLSRKAEAQPSDQEWVIFPQVPFTKEPLGPIYRPDDSQFADIVNWTVYAMLTADENRINQTNVFEAQANPAHAQAGRLLGGPGEVQSLMGLAPDAFFQVIAQVGSYNDVYVRHLEAAGMPRTGSLNELWNDGGIMYPPPVR